ncbi:MAG: sulfatase [Candidatus Coatesbacteria bacterium]|nr:MAG: sulfatase [Candidatus Coatesbacteria bacterium]
MVKKTLTTALAAAAAAAATGFFWGGSEALVNYFWPPRATWHPDRLLESAYGREVFYAAVALAAVLLFGAGRLFIRIIRKREGARSGRRRPGAAVAVAAVAVSNAGWFAASRLGRGALDLGERLPFLLWWGAVAALGVGAAVGLVRAVGGRRWWRKTARLLAVVGVVGFVAVAAARWAERTFRPVPHGPNVVIVILDAWRADAFRAGLTPHLHSYAEENAVIYRRAWSCASWTSPAMASLFTGQYYDTHRLRSGPLADDVSPTLAQAFRAAGYDTAALVGNRLLDRFSPIVDGFDDYRYWHWSPLLRALGFYHTNWYGPAMRTLLQQRLSPATSRELTVQFGRYLKRKHRRPYFLWVHYMDPHTPYSPPAGYYLPGDERYIREYYPKMKSRRFAHHRLYEGECAFVDDLLEPMILPTLAADDNTIVVITSDHGEEFWEHGNFDHGKSVYEPAVRVPLIISVPGVAPARLATPVSHVDLAPTLLSLAGLEIPAAMQGRPFPVALGPEAGTPVFVGSPFTPPRSRETRADALVAWPYKFIVNHEDMSRGGDLYDLAADAGERHPLSHNETTSLLRVRIQRWKHDTESRRPSVLPEAEGASEADLRALGYIQ